MGYKILTIEQREPHLNRGCSILYLIRRDLVGGEAESEIMYSCKSFPPVSKTQPSHITCRTALLYNVYMNSCASEG